jgi:hypothetical protein
MLLNSQKYGTGIRDPEKPIPEPGVKKKRIPDLHDFYEEKKLKENHTVAYPVLLALFKSVVDGEIPAAPGGHCWLIS